MMSSKTDPDRQLRQFLQDYHPPVPPASPGLESQLFQQIQPRSSASIAAIQPRKINRRWLSAGVVLVGMAIAGGLGLRLHPETALTPTSPETLDAFLQDSWTGAIAVTEEAEWVEVQTELTSPSQEWWQLTKSTATHSTD
jgi:hypothetical protein